MMAFGGILAEGFLLSFTFIIISKRKRGFVIFCYKPCRVCNIIIGLQISCCCYRCGDDDGGDVVVGRRLPFNALLPSIVIGRQDSLT